MVIGVQSVSVNSCSKNEEYKAEQILNSICNYLGICSDLVKSKSRKQEIAFARHLCAWFIKANTELPFYKIGIICGGRKRCTAMKSVALVKSSITSRQENKIKDYYYQLIDLI